MNNSIDKDYFIYRYTWPDGHVYIGKSKNGRKRYGQWDTYKKCPLVYNYFKKHGEPKKEILEENLSEDEINEKEIYYIKMNNSYELDNKFGLNLTRGGDGGNIIGDFSKEKREEINHKRQQSFLKNNDIEEYSQQKKEYYKQHPELKQQISESLKEYYKNNPDKKEEVANRLQAVLVSGEAWHERMDKYKRSGEQAFNNRSCICIETQEIFYSCVAAAEKYGGSYKVIHKSCKGECKTAAGFHWAYCEDVERINELSQFKGQPRQIFKKRVLCVETGEIFNSPVQAAKKFNVSNYIIRARCGDGKMFQNCHLQFIE